MAKTTTTKRIPKFDLEVTLSSALIGISNLVFDDQAVQGICSVLSPALGHYSAIWIQNWRATQKVETDQRAFEKTLKDNIKSTEDELAIVIDPSRKAELEDNIRHLRKTLTDSQRDLLEFKRPDYKK